MGIRLDELKVRMLLAGPRNHFGGKVDADTSTRLNGSEQRTVAATYLQYPLTRTNQKAIDLVNAAMIGAPQPRHLSRLHATRSQWAIRAC